MHSTLTPAMWTQFDRDGYARLGPLLSATELAALCQRIDDIMLGRAAVAYNEMVMQLEGESGEYDRPGVQTKGFKKATLNYRVVYGLEHDPLFLTYLQRPIFRDICQRMYGDCAVSTYRAFIMKKPPRGGSALSWHQDRWSFLDRDPLVTIWTALDPVTPANGCLQIVRGSHLQGVINPSHESGFLESTAQIERSCPPERVEHLELAAGEALLLHNWLLHRSGVNTTDIARRGFSVCYMDARTRDKRGIAASHQVGGRYPVVFGPGALEPSGVGAQARQ